MKKNEQGLSAKIKVFLFVLLLLAAGYSNQGCIKQHPSRVSFEIDENGWPVMDDTNGSDETNKAMDIRHRREQVETQSLLFAQAHKQQHSNLLYDQYGRECLPEHPSYNNIEVCKPGRLAAIDTYEYQKQVSTTYLKPGVGARPGIQNDLGSESQQSEPEPIIDEELEIKKGGYQNVNYNASGPVVFVNSSHYDVTFLDGPLKKHTIYSPYGDKKGSSYSTPFITIPGTKYYRIKWRNIKTGQTGRKKISKVIGPTTKQLFLKDKMKI